MHLPVTGDVCLTDFRPTDKAACVEWLNDREVYDRTLRIPHPYTEDHFDDWLDVVAEATERRGDLRHLRNSIVHHRGVALKDVERCVILTWFKEGDSILLTPEQFEQIILQVRSDLPPYIDSL